LAEDLDSSSFTLSLDIKFRESFVHKAMERFL